ncbi:MAG: LexA family protein, partial [Culicoidibacterales bacterium]
MNTIGERLRQLRVSHGFSVDEIAEKLQLSKPSIYNYEKGNRNISTETLLIFSELYNVSLDYLIAGKGSADMMIQSDKKLPIIGKIPAGTRIAAITSFDGEVYIPSPIFEKHGTELFALRVKGDSMSRVVPDKSIAVIKRQNFVENGEIAVILVNGYDATLKRFFRLDDETVVLKPDSYSDEYKPEIIDLKQVTIEILG